MSDVDKYLSATIDDYLLSLAEGIQLAQGRLDQQTATGGPAGSATWSYYLPKVEFELKVTVEMVESKTVSKQLGTSRLRELGDRHLMMRPYEPSTNTNTNVEVTAASVIRGTFVAVPANAGKPALVLRSTVTALEPRRIEFAVEVSDATTAAKPGLEVHFNVDADLSRSASKATGHDVELAAGTWLEDGVATTDQGGVARSVLQIANDETVGVVVVVVLDVAGRTELVHYAYEGN